MSKIKNKKHTRNEHYIPQFYFRQFSNCEKGIYRFDINNINSESVMVSINKQCSETDLYEFINNDESIVMQNFIEKILADFESEISKAFESIKKKAFNPKNYYTSSFLTKYEKQCLTLFIALLIVRSPDVIKLGKDVSKEIISDKLTDREARNIALMGIFPVDNKINTIESTLLFRICEEFEDMTYNIGVSSNPVIVTNDFPLYLLKENGNLQNVIKPDRLIFPLTSKLVLYMLPKDNTSIQTKNTLFPLTQKLIDEELFCMTIRANKWLYSHSPISKKQKKIIYKGIKGKYL